MNHPAKILVIIPCYNEEANIVSTVERLRATCPQVDFLIINDCSTCLLYTSDAADEL